MTEQQNGPSNEPPMESFDRGNPQRRCTAKRSDGSGERCRKWAIRGGSTCATHGSSTKAAKAKARERLEAAADRMAKALLGMATDENVSESVRLAAIKDALSRAGVTEKTAVEVEHSMKPYEQVLDGIAGKLEITSRADYRRAVGIKDDSDDVDPLAGLYARDAAEASRNSDGVIDALVVDVKEGDQYEGYSDVRGDLDRPPSERTEPRPQQGLTLVEAAEQVQHLNQYNARRQGDDQRAKIHTPQRALPPGRP